MQFGNIKSLGNFNYDGFVKVADVEITDPNTKLLLNGNSKPDGYFSFHSDGEDTHTIVYLDYANFKINNGTETLWSNDCTSLSDWYKYEVKGSSISQVTFDSKSCFKFDAGTGQTQVGIVSGVMMGNYYNNGIKNVGTGKWSVEFSYYGDVVGGYGAYFNGFQLSIGLDKIYIGLTIWDGGFNCWNGTSHVSLGDPFLPDVWQTWRIEVDVPTNTANFYLNNALTYTGVTLATTTYNNPWLANTGQNPVFQKHACCTQSLSKFGDGCLSFDGTDDYVTLADSSDWDFGSGDFTIDTWVRFNSIAGHAMFYTQYENANNYTTFFWQNDNNLYFYQYASSAYVVQFHCSWTPVINTWYHVSVVRNGNTWYLFADGDSKSLTLDAGSYSATLTNLAGLIYIGQNGAGINYFNGYLDEFRVSKGIARWTSGFTPSTSEYPINYETNSLLISDTLDGDTAGDYVLESRIVAGKNTDGSTYGVLMNSDTGYYSYPMQWLHGNNGSISAGRINYLQSYNIAGSTIGGGMTSDQISYSRVLIPSKSGNIRTGFSEQTNAVSGTTVTSVTLEGAAYINTFGDPANITGMTVVSPSGGIGYGSRFILWQKRYHS
jgi:hypothetical protein